MINNDIQVQERKQRSIIQTYYKLRYNHNNYTFLDYTYEDTGEPLEEGEMSSIFDHKGNLVENEDLKETFGVFVDLLKK